MQIVKDVNYTIRSVLFDHIIKHMFLLISYEFLLFFFLFGRSDFCFRSTRSTWWFNLFFFFFYFLLSCLSTLFGCLLGIGFLFLSGLFSCLFLFSSTKTIGIFSSYWVTLIIQWCGILFRKGFLFFLLSCSTSFRRRWGLIFNLFFFFF